MFEPNPYTEAYGPESHDAAHSTVDESDDNPPVSKPTEYQSSDSRSKPGDATDQLNAPLRQLLSTMASHPPLVVEADLKKLREMIKTNQLQVNIQDDDTKIAPLHIAAGFGLVDAVEELLKAGAKLEIQDCEGRTPLMTATENEQVEIMEQFLTAQSEYDGVKSQLEITDNLGRTPLLSASINSFPEGVRLLIDAGADCNARTLESKSTPLIAASSWGYRNVVEMLLDTRNPHGRADVNLQDTEGCTALHAAIIKEQNEIAELLLYAEADFERKNKNGQNALHLASKRGDTTIIGRLMQLGAAVDEMDNNYETPFKVTINSLQQLQTKLSLGQNGSVGLSAEEASRAELQRVQQIDTIQLLVAHGALPQTRTYENETVLHLALKCGEPLFLRKMLEKMDLDDLLTRNKDGQTPLSSALQLQGEWREIAIGIFLASDQVMKVVDSDEEYLWRNVLDWAADNQMSHHFVRLVLQHKTRMDTTLPSESRDWSAIRWAAHHQLPVLLRRLVVSSPGANEVEKALKSVLESTSKLIMDPSSKKFIGQLPLVIWLLITASKGNDDLKRSVGAVLRTIETRTTTQKSRKKVPRDIQKAKTNTHLHQDRVDGKEKGNMIVSEQQSGSHEKPFDFEQLETLKIILRDPPFSRTRIHEEKASYHTSTRLKTENSYQDTLNNFDANIVQFFGASGISKTFQATRKVHDVIYRTGPARIMQAETAIQNAVHYRDEYFHNVDSDFTWVYLPVTNMSWMNDLLMRICDDSLYLDTSQYYDIRSFFEDSWSETPDRTSRSRTMRPRTVMRPRPKLRELRKSSSTNLDENEPDFLDASAIYMPYLCFSVNLDGNQDLSPEGGTKNASLPPDQSTGSIVHESPTLDEWYYHFAMDRKSNAERLYRNKSQITTRFLGENQLLRQNEHNEGESASSCPSSELALIRVNQKWIWTIGNRWLITANSCSLGENDGGLVQEILDQVGKQTDHGGRKLQPRSVAGMSQMIIDHCIGSYERLSELPRPSKTPSKEADPSENQIPMVGRELSIRQIYSHYLTWIERNETSLFQAVQKQRFNRLRDLIQRKPNASDTQSEIARKASPQTSYESDFAILEAYSLYSKIKDVRDELNILKSVAYYQKLVQLQLHLTERGGERSAAHVLQNIRELNFVADRIQSAVNMTLSLQQSEMANENTIIVNSQAKLAGRQASVLFVFTFATIVFFWFLQ
ncbi:ankyrin unc44 [Colletotrichum scovillei]|uniref:Ankyrin unc44 n=1 Tax=Colletotrichum scovillei TaxID=1209932 RepID=A0A9P7RIR2_9PEZI|nr:ankyrin unc44 [Colletotrichum scovillei]KAG7084675.1 ankyrin unc44 [Colletotrichum scovillei]